MASIELRVNDNLLEATIHGPQGVAPRLLLRAARKVVGSAKERAPVKTGNLRRSIEAGTIEYLRGSKSSIEIKAKANYAAAVHNGSRPHVIRAKNAPALRFVWPNAPAGLKPARDGFFYFQKVNHPGTKARPFLANALRAEAPKFGFRVTDT